jgi:hypothetical protein
MEEEDGKRLRMIVQGDSYRSKQKRKAGLMPAVPHLPPPVPPEKVVPSAPGPVKRK